jgi:hypothetical protein
MRANESSEENASGTVRALSHGIAARDRGAGPTAGPAGPVDQESPHALLALQHAAGNSAVTRMLRGRQGPPDPVGGRRVQRAPARGNADDWIEMKDMTTGTARPASAGTAAPAPVPPMDLSPDVVSRMLREYEERTEDHVLRQLLGELIPQVRQVEFVGAGARAAQPRGREAAAGDSPAQGGHTVPVSGPDAKYRITLSAAGSREDQIATLVHEMTHVLNYETYDQDAVRVGPGRQDEEKFATYVMQNAGDLLGLLPESGLPPGWQRAVKEKLRSHSAASPTKEYDTVLSHLLVWSEQYGDPDSRFHERLTRLVQETRYWRAQGTAHRNFVLEPGVTFDSALDRLMKA